MRGRYLVPLFLLLAACGTQKAVCPADSTSDIDATVTQLNNPAIFSAVSARHSVKTATVEYAVKVTNRTNEPMRVRSITLMPARFLPPTTDTLQQCFGLEHVNDDVATVSQGFDRTVAPGESETFTLRTGKGFDKYDAMMNDPTLLRLEIRTESTARTRSDHLTRKVALNVPQNGTRS